MLAQLYITYLSMNIKIKLRIWICGSRLLAKELTFEATQLRAIDLVCRLKEKASTPPRSSDSAVNPPASAGICCPSPGLSVERSMLTDGSKLSIFMLGCEDLDTGKPSVLEGVLVDDKTGGSHSSIISRPDGTV